MDVSIYLWKYSKVMNSLVMTLEEDKRFLCVWLFYHVSNFTDSRTEISNKFYFMRSFFLSQCIQQQ